MNARVLPLERMEQRHRGLTQAIAECYYQAACVCLDRHYSSPQEFDLRGDSFERTASVQWKLPDDQCRIAWEKNDATRDGAYACALAATELCLGLYAVSRAETLTGADYYVGPAQHPMDDLENCLRLEISGTHSDIYEVHRRLKRKIKQASKGKCNLPAIVAVVGFGVRLITMQSV